MESALLLRELKSLLGEVSKSTKLSKNSKGNKLSLKSKVCEDSQKINIEPQENPVLREFNCCEYNLSIPSSSFSLFGDLEKTPSIVEVLQKDKSSPIDLLSEYIAHSFYSYLNYDFGDKDILYISIVEKDICSLAELKQFSPQQSKKILCKTIENEMELILALVGLYLALVPRSKIDSDAILEANLTEEAGIYSKVVQNVGFIVLDNVFNFLINPQSEDYLPSRCNKWENFEQTTGYLSELLTELRQIAGVSSIFIDKRQEGFRFDKNTNLQYKIAESLIIDNYIMSPLEVAGSIDHKLRGFITKKINQFGDVSKPSYCFNDKDYDKQISNLKQSM